MPAGPMGLCLWLETDLRRFIQFAEKVKPALREYVEHSDGMDPFVVGTEEVHVEVEGGKAKAEWPLGAAEYEGLREIWVDTTNGEVEFGTTVLVVHDRWLTDALGQADGQVEYSFCPGSKTLCYGDRAVNFWFMGEFQIRGWLNVDTGFGRCRVTWHEMGVRFFFSTRNDWQGRGREWEVREMDCSLYWDDASYDEACEEWVLMKRTASRTRVIACISAHVERFGSVETRRRTQKKARASGAADVKDLLTDTRLTRMHEKVMSSPTMGAIVLFL